MRFDAPGDKIAAVRHFHFSISKGPRQKGEDKMQATTRSAGASLIPLVALGIVEAAIVIASLARIPLPLVVDVRSALVVFVVVGMAMCGIGMGIAQYGWLNPFNLAGILIGVAILAIGALTILGAHLPFVADECAAILVIAALMVVKIVLAGVRGLVS
jgi:hypothetical protein